MSIISIIGLIFFGIICILILTFIIISLFSWVGERWKEFWSEWHTDKKQAILSELGTGLLRQKHWFCESKEAMKAIEAIGEQLQEDKYGVSLDHARDRFRLKMKEAEGKEEGGFKERARPCSDGSLMEK